MNVRLVGSLISLSSSSSSSTLPLLSLSSSSLRGGIKQWSLRVDKKPRVGLLRARPTCREERNGLHLSACKFLSIHPFIHQLFLHPYIHPSIYSSIYLFIHPSIYSSIHIFIHLSFPPSCESCIRLTVVYSMLHRANRRLFIRASIHPSIHPSIDPSTTYLSLPCSPASVMP